MLRRIFLLCVLRRIRLTTCCGSQRQSQPSEFPLLYVLKFCSRRGRGPNNGSTFLVPWYLARVSVLHYVVPHNYKTNIVAGYCIFYLRRDTFAVVSTPTHLKLTFPWSWSRVPMNILHANFDFSQTSSQREPFSITLNLEKHDEVACSISVGRWRRNEFPGEVHCQLLKNVKTTLRECFCVFTVSEQ